MLTDDRLATLLADCETILGARPNSCRAVVDVREVREMILELRLHRAQARELAQAHRELDRTADGAHG